MGAVLSTRTVVSAEVTWFPALSVVTTWRSYSPSVTPVVTQLAAKGDVVSAAATLVHVLAPEGDRWNSAEATPEPVSAEFEVTENVARMFAEATGAVIEPVGAVLSTRTLAIVADVVTLPATSVVTTRRS